MITDITAHDERQGPAALRRIIRDTIVDMFRCANTCACCDSDTNHAAMIERLLARTPVALWPTEDELRAEAHVGAILDGTRNVGGRIEPTTTYGKVAAAIRERCI